MRNFSFRRKILADTLSFNYSQFISFSGKSKERFVLNLGDCTWKQIRRLKRLLPNAEINFYSRSLAEITITKKIDDHAGWLERGSFAR